MEDIHMACKPKTKCKTSKAKKKPSINKKKKTIQSTEFSLRKNPALTKRKKQFSQQNFLSLPPRQKRFTWQEILMTGIQNNTPCANSKPVYAPKN
jgi:hypothetical protein